MKKSTATREKPSLVIRRETLRTLKHMDLSRVAGGDAAAQAGTGSPETGCILQARP